MIKVTYLYRIVTQRSGHIMQARYALIEQVEISDVILYKEIVLIFFQFLCKILKLFVMDTHISEVASYTADSQ